MSSDVEKIKERLGVVDVVSSYIKLDKTGKNLKARCPFHNEKTPSFFVSPARESFYCFGCGAGGDIFSFVEKFEGLDFRGALGVLAARAGVELISEPKESKDARQRIFSVLEETALFFENNLIKSKEAARYLKNRGLKEKTIQLFRLGFAPPGWGTTFDFLRKNGWSELELKEAGLIRISERGEPYDWFRERIMFPFNDGQGRVIAFSGRTLKEDENNPRYINSPETLVFNKSKILYGFDKAKSSVRKNDFCVLVEGQMDVLLAHQIGYRNTVGLSGTALTSEHLNLIRRLTDKLVLAFDADGAGFRAARTGARLVLKMGIDLKVARMPTGSDPADLIIKNETEWRKAIKESKHIIDFDLDNILSGNYDRRKTGIMIGKELLPYVAMVENKIDQSNFVKRISEKTGIAEESLVAEVRKLARQDLDGAEITRSEPELSANVDISDRKKNLERSILAVVVWQQSLKKPVLDVKEVKDRFLKISGRKAEDLVPAEEEEKLIFEAEAFYGNSGKLIADLEEMFVNLEENCLRDNLNDCLIKIDQAEKEGNKKETLKLLNQCQEISEQIQRIREKRFQSS